MPAKLSASNVTASTQFLEAGGQTYAYRRFGAGSAPPLLFLQHFTGTLDNWDPAVTDPLAAGREVILFENAGLGRSTGTVPESIAGMAQHALRFLDGLGVVICDVLGFSLGGMIAQQVAQDRPSVFRRMMLVGTAPRGGEERDLPCALRTASRWPEPTWRRLSWRHSGNGSGLLVTGSQT
jgi:pimeloyl-ACP methyl ester carboxylesterase